jgi:hypothetical protein
MSTLRESSNPNIDLFEFPQGFVPGEHDVVFGKGKKFHFHTGNQWLRTLVASILNEYTQAQTKTDKSNIISDVVEYVKNNGRFIKQDLHSGMWVHAEPLLCREKCSQTFRDNLAQVYRSSNVAKRNKRRQEQQNKKLGTDIPAKRMKLSPGPVSIGFGQPCIPSNIFDQDLALWSPKAQTRSISSLDASAFDAVTHGNVAGATGNHHFALKTQPHDENSGFTAFEGTSSSNNHNICISNLTQSLTCNAIMDQAGTVDPFEPTPLPPMPAMPPLMGGAAPGTTWDHLAPFSIDANSIVGALENALLQQQVNTYNSYQPQHGVQQKRHSLAPLLGDDWFHFPAPSNDESYQNIATAFAA